MSIFYLLKKAIDMLKSQPENQLWFTRPSEDLKQFSGQVMTTKECIEFFTNASECESSVAYNISPDTVVVLATPKNILAEWRWFVVDRKIISGSMYRFKGQQHSAIELDALVIIEAQGLANDWLPHDNCVMDLALTEDGIKVIEFNCINSSGFYDNDVNLVFSALWDYYRKY